jgi:hypothetical protein
VRIVHAQRPPATGVPVISPPPTSKGEIPTPAAGSHPRKQVSTCQGLVIPPIEWNSPRGNFEAGLFEWWVNYRAFKISSMRCTAIVGIFGMQYIDTVLIPSSLDPAVWDTPGASDYAPRRGRNEIVSEPNMLLDLSKRFEMRSAVVALGLVLCAIPPCLAMPVAPLPVSRTSIQVHGCHHQYAHDLTGWHRHDNNCRTPR